MNFDWQKVGPKKQKNQKRRSAETTDCKRNQPSQGQGGPPLLWQLALPYRPAMHPEPRPVHLFHLLILLPNFYAILMLRVHFWVCLFAHFPCFLHRFFKYVFSIDLAMLFGMLFHRFSSTVSIYIVPLSHIANLVFEQQYGVLRSKSRFYLFYENIIFQISTPRLLHFFALLFQ
jgi:hypothetical protein